MRRKFLFIPLTLAVGVLSIGHLSAANKSYQKVSADEVPDYQTYVPLRDGWIENTDGSAVTDLNSAIRARNDRFWNGAESGWDSQERSFNALDEFIDTIHKANGGDKGSEEWRGAYRTPELVLKDNNHRYVSFLFGGGGDDIFVNIFQVTGEAGSGDRISGIRTALDTTGYFDNEQGINPDKLNAPISCNMVFKYYELPNEIQPGDHFLIYVRDGRTGGYGGFTFGDVHINQTLSDVARSFSAHKTQMKLNEYISDWTRNANEYVLNYYATDSYYATVRNAEANLTDANDGFEVNNRLSKWAYDQQNSTYENGALANINYDYIYSDKEIKWGAYFYDNDGLMPINKTGNKFLSGEPNDVDGNNCGLPESAKYRLVSPEFKLSGSGLISAKIGGHYTALQLLDSNLNVIATTGDVNPSFADKDMKNIALSGGRQCTMTRTYLDCGEFVGQRVHIAIADTQTGGGWNLAYFDEIITNYPTLPTFQVDTFEQYSRTEDKTFHGYILDKYIDNGHNPIFKSAYDFMEKYYSNLRSPDNEFNYSKASEDGKIDVCNAYLALESNGRSLVQRSADIRYTETYVDNWYINAVDASKPLKVSDSDFPFDVMFTTYDQIVVSFNANGGTGSMANRIVVNGTQTSYFQNEFTAPAGKEFSEWNTNTIGNSNITISPIWVNKAVVTQLENTSSIAALRFHYVEKAEGYDYSDVAIRFGAFISASVWEELNNEETVEGYGIIVAETAHITGTIQSNYEAAEGDSVDAKLASLCASEYIKKASRTGNTPAAADDQQKAYMKVGGNYYVWQVRQNIVNSFTTQYTSVAYIKLNGGIIFLGEVTYSAKELATAVLPSVDENSPSRDPIQVMANHD